MQIKERKTHSEDFEIDSVFFNCATFAAQIRKLIIFISRKKADVKIIKIKD